MTQRPRTGGPAKASASAKGATKGGSSADPGAEPVEAKEAEPGIEASPEPVETTVEDSAPSFEEPATAASIEAVTKPETVSDEAVIQPAALPSDAVIESATPNVAPSDAVVAAATAATNRPSHNPMQGMMKMMKSTEELFAFGQANVEAFVKSGQIWAAGVQELTKQMASCAKESFDESVSTFKAMTAAKSVQEALELQSTFAKTAFEKAMAESNKLTDASIKLTEEAIAPITARLSVAVETFGKAV